MSTLEIVLPAQTTAPDCAETRTEANAATSDATPPPFGDVMERTLAKANGKSHRAEKSDQAEKSPKRRGHHKSKSADDHATPATEAAATPAIPLPVQDDDSNSENGLDDGVKATTQISGNGLSSGVESAISQFMVARLFSNTPAPVTTQTPPVAASGASAAVITQISAELSAQPEQTKSATNSSNGATAQTAAKADVPLVESVSPTDLPEKNQPQPDTRSLLAELPQREKTLPVNDSKPQPQSDSDSAKSLSSGNLAEVATAVEPKSNPNQMTFASAPETSPSAMPTTGISAAQQDAQMKKSENTNKFAGETEKVLPETAELTAVGENLPGNEKSGVIVPLRAEHAEHPANVVQIPTVSEHQTSTNIAPLEQISTGSSVVDVRARALDRIDDMTMLHATRLQQTNNDVVNVTIRPAAGLELSLELRHGENGVEAQATLQHGDYNFLNANWSDLQQRLEGRGVRLAPLTCAEQFSNNTQQQFSQQQRQQAQPQDDAAFAGAFADFVMAGAIAKQASPPVPARGWESWA